MRLRPDVWILEGQRAALIVPTGCAACGVATPRARRLSRGHAAELLVPYCATCLQRLARGDTLALVLALAATLLALVVALVFPVVWPRAGLPLHVAASILAALIPHAAAHAFSLRWPLSARRPSVYWTRAGQLACRRREFAEQLARFNQLEVSRRASLPPMHPLSGVALAIAVGVSPLLHFMHHPALRVLNLSGQRLWIRIDGEQPIPVEPTLRESPRAGRSLRLPRGERLLEALDASGRVISSVHAELLGDREHLYAPGSDGQCFWLEATGYGQVRERRVTELPSPTRFWQLEPSIDTWFVRSPEPPPGAGRSSGGKLVALRHGRCTETQLSPGTGSERAGRAAHALGAPPASGP